MKVIIAGSREGFDIYNVYEAVGQSYFEITEVVSGTARGVDRLGEIFAEKEGIPVKKFPADWDNLGKLLYSLWIDGEGFSGKRPFGNSGWDIDVARAIYDEGVISGTKNKWGDWDIEWPDVTEVIQKAINEAFNIKVEKKFK